MSRRTSPVVALLVSLALAWTASARHAQAQTPVRIGPELQVNVYVTGRQQSPDVVVRPDGGFVVVWQSNPGQDGNEFGVFGRRFNSGGAPAASEFQVNVATIGNQGYPSIAVDADGDFMVAWGDGFIEDGGVLGRRYDSTGAPQTAELHLNAFTVQVQAGPSIASEANGDFVVVWASLEQDGDSWGVFGRRFASSGASLAAEFQVNVYTIESQQDAEVALYGDDDFVVVWRSTYQDGDQDGVFARRFDSNGVPQASEFQISASTIGYQATPAVHGDADGGFVVAFTANGDGSDTGTFARRFDSAGTPLAIEFQVNAYTTTSQRQPTVAHDADGDFVIAFQSNAQDGSEYGIFARRFSSAGVALGSEFQVNTYTQTYQSVSAIASAPDGDFVVAWLSYGQDEANNTGIFAQRFASTFAGLDVDGNGATDALTDGLLALRHLFGFTGTALTGGTIGAGCTRCDSASIAPYLTGLGLVLDVDDNNDLDALTDGLLILRFLFGFTGTTLTSGATALDCVRCDAAAILPYLQTLD